MTQHLIFRFVAACSLVATFSSAHAQQPPEETAVRSADAAFWTAFNACDAKAMARYFTPDAEFYHDKTGLTQGREAVVASMVNGPCGTNGMHLRREAIADSVRYGPVPNFGATLTGEHRFYVKQGDAPEHLDGQAKFAVVWARLADGWQMRRVLSLDHGPAPYATPAEIKLRPELLASYTGKYRSSHAGDIEVLVKGDQLLLAAGDFDVALHAEAEGRFFAAGRDLHFEFVGDAMIVRENGSEVERAVRVR
jgi:hypothetical protein